MPDSLLIHRLAAQCRIGITEAERRAPQPIWIDLELTIDAAKASARDDVQDAIDYAQLVAAVKSLAESQACCLMETLAERVAQLVLQQFQPAAVRVRVVKRALPDIDDAAVEIQRPAP